MDAGHNGAVDEIMVIVFADRDILGHHPDMIALRQGYSYVDVSGDDVDACVARSAVDDYGEIDTGQGSYLLTATLRCVGLGVRPGGSVAFVRAGVAEQASIVFHQADDDRPVPSDAVNTAVVRDWPGPAWAEKIHVVRLPDPSPPTEWPANAALRTIGVQRAGSPDEATALGLDLPPPAAVG
jgi:hypothetical protein